MPQQYAMMNYAPHVKNINDNVNRLAGAVSAGLQNHAIRKQGEKIKKQKAAEASQLTQGHNINLGEPPEMRSGELVEDYEARLSLHYANTIDKYIGDTNNSLTKEDVMRFASQLEIQRSPNVQNRLENIERDMLLERDRPMPVIGGIDQAHANPNMSGLTPMEKQIHASGQDSDVSTYNRLDGTPLEGSFEQNRFNDQDSLEGELRTFLADGAISPKEYTKQRFDLKLQDKKNEQERIRLEQKKADALAKENRERAHEMNKINTQGRNQINIENTRSKNRKSEQESENNFDIDRRFNQLDQLLAKPELDTTFKNNLLNERKTLTWARAYSARTGANDDESILKTIEAKKAVDVLKKMVVKYYMSPSIDHLTPDNKDLNVYGELLQQIPDGIREHVMEKLKTMSPDKVIDEIENLFEETL